MEVLALYLRLPIEPEIWIKSGIPSLLKSPVKYFVVVAELPTSPVTDPGVKKPFTMRIHLLSGREN